MPSNRWLTKQEYDRIRYKAKKLGALSSQFKYIAHTVNFEHTFVYFAFYPLQYHVRIREKFGNTGHFRTKAEADAIKRDMDAAIEFIEFLKEFNTQLPPRP